MLINEPNELLGYHVGLQQTVGANEQLAMVSYEIHSQQLSIKDTLCVWNIGWLQKLIDPEWSIVFWNTFGTTRFERAAELQLLVPECWWNTFLSPRGGRFLWNETGDLGYLDWQNEHAFSYILSPVVVGHDRDYIHYILQIWISSHHGMLIHSKHSSVTSVTALRRGSGVNLQHYFQQPIDGFKKKHVCPKVCQLKSFFSQQRTAPMTASFADACPYYGITCSLDIYELAMSLGSSCQMFFLFGGGGRVYIDMFFNEAGLLR